MGKNIEKIGILENGEEVIFAIGHNIKDYELKYLLDVFSHQIYLGKGKVKSIAGKEYKEDNEFHFFKTKVYNITKPN